jgi:hypothetical protein
MNWFAVSNVEKTDLPEERYYRQQVHVKKDKNLSHHQT